MRASSAMVWAISGSSVDHEGRSLSSATHHNARPESFVWKDVAKDVASIMIKLVRGLRLFPKVYHHQLSRIDCCR